MPTVHIDDTTLHYERSGSGPAMLFVHGMCGDAEVWADQARRAEASHTCVRYDRRGHSRSTRGRRAVSATRHADDAAILIEALGLAPCLVVASSAGAVITVELARRHGRLLRGVVLSEPPLFDLDPPGQSEFVATLRLLIDAALADGGPEAVVDAFFSYVCPSFWAEIGDEAKQRYRANAGIGLEDLGWPPLEVSNADLNAMTIPALVLVGTESHPLFGTVARRLAEAWPTARLVELVGSGHVTYAEQPERFGDEIASFAAGLAETYAAAPASSARGSR